MFDSYSEKKFLAGAGSAEIVFSPVMFPTEGFSTIHDNPHVRVLILDGDLRLAFVACELVVVAKPFVAEIKKIVNEITGTNEENIWVHGTHAISTPHAPGPKPIGPVHLRKQPTEEEKLKRELYSEALYEAAAQAAQKAVNCMRPAVMGFGKGCCDVNVSSRELDRDHGMLTDIEGLDVVDKKLNIIKIAGEDGSVIALVLNYALMSNAIDNSEMEAGTRQVSSDVPGEACRLLEEKYGAPVLFFMAAAADQKPKEQAMYFERSPEGERVKVDKGVAFGLELVKKYGLLLAESAMEITDRTVCDNPAPFIASVSSPVKVKNRPRPGMPGPAEDPGESELSVLAANIGGIGIVATNPELCCATGLELKEASPFKETLLFSFTDGPKGIMADAASFAKQCPEQRASFAEQGSAEKFVATAVKLLKTIYNCR